VAPHLITFSNSSSNGVLIYVAGTFSGYPLVTRLGIHRRTEEGIVAYANGSLDYIPFNK
jgi:hypothetical protein